MSEKCDECGTELIDNCVVCGAPVCCPRCCERDHLNKRIAELEAILDEICDTLEAEPESKLNRYLFKLADISEGGGDDVCIACNGSGHYDHNGSPPCSECNGTGKVRRRRG